MFNMILFYIRIKTGLFVKRSNDVPESHTDYVSPVFTDVNNHYRLWLQAYYRGE